MTFREPQWLFLLLVAAGLAAAYVVMQRRRSAYAVRFATLPMLEKVAPRRPGWRRHLPAAVFLAAMVLLTIAIARPVADMRVPRERATVIVALDASLSMRATDVSPSRIEVAKEAAVGFVENLPEQFNVGVVTFSGSAAVAAPPTTDHAAAAAAIDQLDLQASTAIGEAVFTSLQAISSFDARFGSGAQSSAPAEEKPPARIVLLSDGANTSGRPIDAAAEAASEAGVPVSTIAYGTPEGTVEVDGRVTPVPVDAASLERLADSSGGAFYTAESDAELRGVYEDLESSIGWTTEEREITNIVAGIALAAALLTGIASLVWFSRLP
jgi:Ca-activated chloride channel homolog